MEPPTFRRISINAQTTVGALLLHGLTDTPTDLGPVATKLEAAGVLVITRLLPADKAKMGAGSSYEEMLESGCQDWIAGAQEGFDVLAEQCDKIVIVGLSMGAIAAIIIASRNQKVAGLGLLSPTIKNNGSETSKVSRLSPLIDAFPFLDKWRARASSPQQFDQMVKYCRTAAPNVKCPALVLHSREDSLTAEANALEAYRMLGSREKRMVMLSGCNPALTSDLRKEDVANLIVKLAIDASYYDPEGALLKSEVLGLV